MRRWALGVGCLVALAIVGCSRKDEGASGTPSGDKSLVVFAQANSADPWRQVFDAEIKQEAVEHSDSIAFEMQAAEDDAKKQMDVIDTFLVKEPKVLLVSPVNESLQPSIEKAFDKGIPVILLDRAVDGEKWTCWIGGDNKEIGRQAGAHIADKLGGKGTVLMIRGIATATPTVERGGGAMESFAKSPGIKVIEGDDCGYQRQKARAYMESFLQKGQKIDAIYAHNDEMAIGAYMAWEAWASSQTLGGKLKRPLIVGIDACQKEVVDFIKDGKMDATFRYPNPGPMGIHVAVDILAGKNPERRIVLPTEIITKDNADDYLRAHPKLHG